MNALNHFKFLNTKLLLLTLCFSLINLQSHSQTKKNQLKISGFGELDHISYFKSKENKINSRNQSILNLELSKSFKGKSVIKTELEYRNDLSDKARNRLFIDRLYIDLFFDKMDIRIGRQLINWGQTDGFNPLNNINPIDFTDLLDTADDIRSVYALSCNYYLNDVKLNFIVVPVFSPSLLPNDSRSRWLAPFPRLLPDSNNPNQFRRASFSIEEPLFKHNFKDELQFGLKASTAIEGYDVAFSYYNGFNDVPKYLQQIQFISNDSIAISLKPEYYRWQVLGFDFATTLGPWGFRGESGLFFSNGTSLIPKDPAFLQSVFGVDRIFSNFIGENNLFMLVQWISDVTLSENKFPNNDINHLFRNSLFVRLENEMGPYSNLNMQLLFDIKSNTLYFRPSFTYEFHDGLNLEVLVDVINTSQKDAFFRPFNRNDRIQIRMKYDF